MFLNYKSQEGIAKIRNDAAEYVDGMAEEIYTIINQLVSENMFAPIDNENENEADQKQLELLLIRAIIANLPQQEIKFKI